MRFCRLGSMNPTKKTPEMRERLVALRRKGLSLAKCQIGAGIGKKTLQDWRKEDPSLEEALNKAFNDCVEENHDLMMKGAAENPRHALEILERLAPEDYSKTERVEYNIILEMPGLLRASTGRAQAFLKKATDDDWKALDARAAAGELTDTDYELLETPEDEDPNED
jgi:hypothetical protein